MSGNKGTSSTTGGAGGSQSGAEKFASGQAHTRESWLEASAVILGLTILPEIDNLTDRAGMGGFGRAVDGNGVTLEC